MPTGKTTGQGSHLNLHGDTDKSMESPVATHNDWYNRFNPMGSSLVENYGQIVPAETASIEAADREACSQMNLPYIVGNAHMDFGPSETKVTPTA